MKKIFVFVILLLFGMNVSSAAQLQTKPYQIDDETELMAVLSGDSGQKYTKTFHFTDEYHLKDVAQYSVTVSLYYNSSGEKCISIEDVEDCNDDTRELAVERNFTTSGGSYFIYLTLDPDYGDSFYDGQSFDSFSYDGDMYLDVQRTGATISLILTQEETDESQKYMDDGDGEKGSLVDEYGDPDGKKKKKSQDSFTPAKLCEDGDCDISFDSFCETAPVKRVLKFIGMSLVILKILIPLILVGFGIVSLVQVIIAGKEEEMKGKFIGIVKRVLIGIVIFLLPGIVDFLFDTVTGITGGNNSSIGSCEACLLDLEHCD